MDIAIVTLSVSILVIAMLIFGARLDVLKPYLGTNERVGHWSLLGVTLLKMVSSGHYAMP